MNVNDNRTVEARNQLEGKRNKCIVHENTNVHIIKKYFKSMLKQQREITPIHQYLMDYAEILVALNGIEQIFDVGKIQEKKSDARIEDQNQLSPILVPKKWEHQTCLKYLLYILLNYV